MSAEIIQGKAKEFLQRMYGETNPEFSFSSGWLERFKARYGIKFYQCFGESGSVIMENIENALPGIRSKLDQFQLKDSYNMEETGLFCRLKTDHSLATKQLKGRKKDKERINVVFCCNGDGFDKVSLWVIGKYANPRWFKNVNMNNLNCKYRSNKKAWMTDLLFQDFVGWFDKRMKGMKVLFIVDDCPTHPKVVEGLRNVELFFLPPNTTSKIQPCDAGIIRVFKDHYRRHFYSSILQGLKVEAPNPEKINILNAINFANTTWNFDVKTTTIANCFRHCKIRSEENNIPEPEVGELEENEEIIQSVMNSNDDENNPEPDDSSVVPNVSSKEAFQAVVTLSNYLLQHEQNIPEVVYALQKVKDVVHFDLGGKKKQSTIDAYFQKE
ncbi:CENP-B homolog protein 2-like [Olea europaea var. sylvestris]|uniref:CENP-B homolog protein 2-like n=1 Tax=Olea europaea var. sylvestris TaxID=158386 RepID=UPI000C1D8B7E|nr:CENP-B homolog protein 2-like [Olea europaea var. sylvestris]